MAVQTDPNEMNEVYQDRARNWHGFTQFMVYACVAVAIVLVGLALHMPLGWGWAIFLMIAGLGILGLTILVRSL